jgi:hypothetical protein
MTRDRQGALCIYDIYILSITAIAFALVASQAELEDQVWISTSFEDLCDQNVIVYLLRVKAKEYMPQVGVVASWHANSKRCQQHPGVCQGCHTCPFENTIPSPNLMPFPADPAGGRPVLHELLVQGVPGLQLIMVHCTPPLLVVVFNTYL